MDDRLPYEPGSDDRQTDDGHTVCGRTDNGQTGGGPAGHGQPDGPRQGLRLGQRTGGWWRNLGFRKHLILFALTVLTTYLVGGPVYSATLMTILLAHESGHYLMTRRYGIPATLPYFIPLPLPPFGTLGAVIKMRGRMTHRRALLDIAVAGPLAGLFFAIPALAIGLRLSEIIPVENTPGFSLQLGESLLFTLVARLTVGPVSEGQDLLLHPMAYAAWTGLFVTALNLLPVGQLDGGHVIYALLGRQSKKVFVITLIAFAVICAFFYPGWALLIMLILFFGFQHAPPLDDVTPLSAGRKVLGVLVMVLFILAFTPVPFKL
jgi:membrane-associated protease RseP (regulator of RpoE activity)